LTLLLLPSGPCAKSLAIDPVSICITGFDSTIAQRFCSLLSPDEAIEARSINDVDPEAHSRYLICTGFLAGKALGDIGEREASKTWEVNFLWIAQVCDSIIAGNPAARICIIGSESGYRGSYDMAYAGAKTAIHHYIETKALLFERQQIVGIAPGIIIDSGMTQRRDDKAALMERADKRRRREWINAIDVARLAHFLLYVDSGNITNTIIRMTGGE
jgi:NAD(P)-dependent dehydrogenase (short-subunit alcohol dehydrogenase family)